jgi:polyketide synthase 7
MPYQHACVRQLVHPARPSKTAGIRVPAVRPRLEPMSLTRVSVMLALVLMLQQLCHGHAQQQLQQQGAPPLGVTALPPATMKHVIAKGLTPCKAPPFACVQAVTTRTPKPTPGEVLVRLTSSSVNPSDLDMEEQIGRLEGTLGVDFAGVVVEVGAASSRLKVGDSVWGVTKGAYAEYVIAVELVTGVVPVGLNMSAAGTIPEVGATSLQCLQRLGAPWDPKRNVTVAITSGTGGTGETIPAHVAYWLLPR